MTASLPSSCYAHSGGVDSVPTTKSAPRRVNVRGHGIGTGVQMQSKPTRAKRRSDVLFTVADNDDQSAAYIAHCLNYAAATVRRDLCWLDEHGYVTVTAGEWSVTAKGQSFLDEEAADEIRRTAYAAFKAGGATGLDDLALRAAAQWAQVEGDGIAEREIDGILNVRETKRND